MLVEQAAEAFLIWRGIRPETRPVIDILKNREHRCWR
jgi:shikimate dehydrogenase